MKQPIRILLQTTIATTTDGWSIARFSLLERYLSSLKDEIGNPLCEVVSRDRQVDADDNDPVLSNLNRDLFDELWLFAVDVGDGISDRECEGISRFRQQGGGILTTRDHMDLGSSLCNLAGIGAAHFFHTKNPDPDATRNCIDDPYTTAISYPNYHSGRNGDYQQIAVLKPVHPLLVNPHAQTGQIDFLPAHPHEGAVGVPTNSNARVIAIGKSLITDRQFNLIVAFERERDDRGHLLGRAVAESTFHHFCDYNWDTKLGCPSFVTEPPGNTMQTEPQAIADLHIYLRNLALWLAPA
ncbi:MAG: hypothetical protein RLZZ135_1860 [Cyanobacteriota bacterium]|jgi:hypothetical protein